MRDAQECTFVALSLISILIHRLISVSGTALDLAAQDNNMCRPQQARSDDPLPTTFAVLMLVEHDIALKFATFVQPRRTVAVS